MRFLKSTSTHLYSTILMISLGGCAVDQFNPNDEIFTGDSAVKHISLCDRDNLPASMSNLWVYDGGSFNGMIYYISFKCDTLEDCWMAVHAFGAPEKTAFREGIQTAFAVNQHGPSYYFKELEHPQWNIPEIEESVFYEKSYGNKKMDFWAIDLDRLRVYFHHESGGFPADPPSIRHRK